MPGCLVPLLLAALQGQVPTPLPRPVGAPTGVLEGDFTQIRGVRELPDGRILIADRLMERVLVGRFRDGSLTPIGRVGGGPQEYRLPAGLVPMPGDSTLLLDEGNGRLAVIGPDLVIHRTFQLRVAEVPTILWPRAVDSEGRYYAQVPGWAAARFSSGDSAPVLRIDGRRTGFRVMAYVMSAPRPSLLNGPAARPRMPMEAFGGYDAWTVAPDGALAVVRYDDYRVEWFREGAKRTGPRIGWTPVPVTAADREDFARRFLENSGVGGRAGDDRPPEGISPTPRDWLTDQAVRELVEASAFARAKPPFTDAPLRISPEGELWVERSTPRGELSTWDLFDTRGHLQARVQLPAGRRLVGLGRGVLYAAVADQDGVERLERYGR